MADTRYTYRAWPLLLAAVLLSPFPGHAQEGLAMLPECRPTPSRPAGAGYPGGEGVGTSNNLRQLPGSAVAAMGKKVTILGRVLDSACVPVQNAVVELWQEDASGKTGKARDRHFAGSGRALTDNLGEFQFVTVEPGNAPPVAHLRVSHPAFPAFTTDLYLRPESVHAAPELRRYTVAERERLAPGTVREVAGEAIVTFDVTLQGRAPYRGY